MKSENFCYWLQSAFELMDCKTFNEEQVIIIKNHLSMVFEHEIDPKLGDKKHQEKLQQLHDELRDASQFSPSGVLFKC